VRGSGVGGSNEHLKRITQEKWHSRNLWYQYKLLDFEQGELK